MLDQIKHGFRNIFELDGRDDRETYLKYSTASIAFVFILFVVAITPKAMKFLFSVVGGLAAINDNCASYKTLIMSNLNDLTALIGSVILLIGAIFIVLFGTIMVRRLHDVDISGFMAIFPLTFHLTALYLLWSQFSQFQIIISSIVNGTVEIGDLMAGNSIGFAINLVFLTNIIAIAFGILPSTDGPNQYGETANAV